MNVYELKRALSHLDDDTEVRLACQPNWPFEYSVGEAIVTEPGEQYYIMLVTPTSGTMCDWADEPGWYVTVDGADSPEPVQGPLPDEQACERWIEEQVGDKKPVLYLAEGTQLGYLDGEGRRALSW